MFFEEDVFLEIKVLECILIKGFQNWKAIYTFFWGGGTYFIEAYGLSKFVTSCPIFLFCFEMYLMNYLVPVSKGSLRPSIEQSPSFLMDPLHSYSSKLIKLSFILYQTVYWAQVLFMKL